MQANINDLTVAKYILIRISWNLRNGDNTPIQDPAKGITINFGQITHDLFARFPGDSKEKFNYFVKKGYLDKNGFIQEKANELKTIKIANLHGKDKDFFWHAGTIRANIFPVHIPRTLLDEAVVYIKSLEKDNVLKIHKIKYFPNNDIKRKNTKTVKVTLPPKTVPLANGITGW